MGVWDGLGLEIMKEVGFEQAREWGEVVMESCMEECVVLMTGCWEIWEARNRMICEGVRVGVRDVLRRVGELIEEMGGVESRHETDSEGSVVVSGWRRPRQGWNNINVDAGMVARMGMGLEAVCRDDEGKVRWGVTMQRLEVRDPQVLEAEGIILGLSEAKRDGLSRVEIESDCLNVIEDLKMTRRGRSDIFLVYDDIFDLCASFESVKFLFIRRTFNGGVHELAHVWPCVWSRSCSAQSLKIARVVLPLRALRFLICTHVFSFLFLVSFSTPRLATSCVSNLGVSHLV
ncbi:uncharacterized protein LOC141613092 [Silene latifolia]|uniref:uncharacterized protein LOC141613092 n=1 Tax=Silene latifolia TaxID=37657 RepID=UPI003D77FAB2